VESGSDEPSPSTLAAITLSAPPEVPPPALLPGQVLAARFRLRRFIAHGGMGEVWEAEDLEFAGEPVAVKTLRSEIARDDWALARFRREIQLARKVTHPNVCRVFDLFYHRPALDESGPPAPITLLAMELLAGETLAERLRRGEPLGAQQALPIARQIAAGLAGAHAAGVVHGDFKSVNVILVGDPAAPRAVITDFGLARGGSEAAAGHASSTAAGDGDDFAGTPGYMAPEQAQGGGASREADVYALGVVLCELMTGRKPLVGPALPSAAPERLTVPSPSPRALVPGLDAALERTILRCLASRPADRFASAAEVAAALAGRGIAPTPRQRRRRWLLAGAVAMATLVALAGALVRSRGVAAVHGGPRGPQEPPAGFEVRRSIAVLGFHNLSGRTGSAWLATALAEMLSTQLTASGQLRVIPAETVARMRVELALADFDSLSRESLAQVRRNLGADLVVVGSYLALGPDGGGRVRVDLRLQDVKTGETVAAVSRSGSEAGLPELVDDTGTQLSRSVGAGAAAKDGAGQALAGYPSDPAAARWYAEGLAKLRLSDPAAARDLLQRAAAASPDHALVHAALAAAWLALGYDERASREAARASQLAAALPREQRLVVEGKADETAGHWAQAVEVYRTLFGFFPDNLEYGIRLVAAQVAAGQGKGVEETLAALRRLPPPAGDDPRIDLAEAQARQARSDFAGELKAAAQCAAKGEAAKARLVVAKARTAQGWAWRNLGDFAKAAAAYEAARAVFEQAGDRGAVATALNDLGIIAWQRGDLPKARRLYEQALAICREIGNQSGIALALNNLAILLWQQGDLTGARALYTRVAGLSRETGDRSNLANSLNNLGLVQKAEGELAAAQRSHREALALRRELGERQGEATSLNNLATVLDALGDEPEARSLYTQALATFRAIGNRSGAADAELNLSEIELRHGELDAAQRTAEEALATKRGIGDKDGTAEALLHLAGVLVERGEIATARPLLVEALALRRGLGDGSGIAAAQSATAQLELAEGHAEACAAAARAAVAQAASAHDRPTAAVAGLMLGRCYLALGAPRDLAAAAAASAAAAGPNPEPALRLALAIVRARAAAARTELKAARRALEAAVAEAHRRGFLPLELEARLGLAGALGREDRDAGAAAARKLAAEARARGLGRLAAESSRLAEDLLRPAGLAGARTSHQ